MCPPLDSYLKKQGKYQKNESKITFEDVQDCLMLGVQQLLHRRPAMRTRPKSPSPIKLCPGGHDRVSSRSSLEVYFIENPSEAEKIAGQVLINKRSRETAEKARLNIKKKLTGSMDI